MPDTPDPETIVGASEAAELLGIHPATLYRWGDEGRVTYQEIAGSRYRRYKVRDLLPLRPRTINPPPEHPE